MFKVSTRKPVHPLHIVYQMDMSSCKAFQKLGYDDELFELAEGVFLMANPQSGNVWVSSCETLRTKLLHAKIFEREVLQHAGID
jgi:hypothetical protein